MTNIDSAIVEFSASFLLRYFKTGIALSADAPRLDLRRDFEMLKSHWAISQPIRKLLSYALEHPHESQSLLAFEMRIDDAVARGRIDARRTLTHRLQSGVSSTIISAEPIRSFNTGSNRLLAWVLREAASYITRFSEWHDDSAPYATFIKDTQRDLRKVQRIEALREALRSVALGRRPGPGDITSARRARQPLYRLAVDALLLLQDLERGDPTALRAVIQDSLIGPLEDWRRFELAVGLAIGEALSDATKAPLQMHILNGASSGPLVTAGRFAVYWQKRTELYSAPPLEPSELATFEILKAYGIAKGSDRPDFIVIDRELSAVVSIIEVKYLTGDTALARFREAVDQIVRYARGYAPAHETAALGARSLVALSHGAPSLLDLSAKVPHTVDFAAITQTGLSSWAQQLLA